LNHQKHFLKTFFVIAPTVLAPVPRNHLVSYFERFSASVTSGIALRSKPIQDAFCDCIAITHYGASLFWLENLSSLQNFPSRRFPIRHPEENTRLHVASLLHFLTVKIWAIEPGCSSPLMLACLLVA
jgi:hypothetical protein